MIDDDSLIHELWKMAARDASVELKCFTSVDDFLENCVDTSLEAKIYVDSNLEHARGEDEAHKLKERGFTNLYIATGYNPEDVAAPDFVLGVVGKRPPF